MKKRFLILVVCACTVIGAAISAASAVSQTNTLISKNYLETTYRQELQGLVSGQVSAGFAAVRGTALQALDTIGEAYLSKLKPEEEVQVDWRVSGDLVAQTGVANDSIILDVGSGIIWTKGNAAFTGILIDTTSGNEISNGTLTANHRYVAAEQVVITVTGNNAAWSVEGRWLSGGKDAEEEPVDPPEPEIVFTDVREGIWYYDSVYYVVERGFFNGTSDTTFSPTQTMTRSMLTTVLYRMAGSPEITYSPIFNDVPKGTWYSDGTVWAGVNNVVKGVGNGAFNPNGELSREQIAQMLYNYANWLGLDTSKRGDVSAFTDAASISGWAKDAVSWAIETGLMQGSAGEVMPKKLASRAEVATLLQRFDLWIFE